jgi:AraC-like DNA-binding protein
MAVIATLLPSQQLQRLRGATRDRHEVVACDDWDTLARTCERQPVRVAVIDLFMDGGEANFEMVRQLKVRLPRLSLICYVAVSIERARDLFDAGRQGMDGLVIWDRDDSPIEFLRVIGQAESRTLADVVRKQVSGADSVVYDAVMLSITRAHERLSPSRLAKLLQVPRRTLSQRLQTNGYPPPLRLLTWGRLIVAAHMMEDRRRSADRVAASLEFPSGSAFRNTCQRYLHSTPGQIRTRGGAQYVIRSFFRQVNSPRKTQAPAASRTARRLALAV